jgi:hypothetical protein
MSKLGRATRGRRYFPGDFYKPGEVSGFRQAFFMAIHLQLAELEKSFRNELLPRALEPDLDMLTLRDALNRWAEKWNMAGVEWFLDRCTDAVRSWHSMRCAFVLKTTAGAQTGSTGTNSVKIFSDISMNLSPDIAREWSLWLLRGVIFK